MRRTVVGMFMLYLTIIAVVYFTLPKELFGPLAINVTILTVGGGMIYGMNYFFPSLMNKASNAFYVVFVGIIIAVVLYNVGFLLKDKIIPGLNSKWGNTDDTSKIVGELGALIGMLYVMLQMVITRLSRIHIALLEIQKQR